MRTDKQIAKFIEQSMPFEQHTQFFEHAYENLRSRNIAQKPDGVHKLHATNIHEIITC